MQKKVFSIFDSKGQFYGPIFIKDQIGEAERDFGLAVNDPSAGLLFQCPEDFHLFHIADWENVTGKLTVFDAPRSLVKGIQLKKSSSVELAQ